MAHSITSSARASSVGAIECSELRQRLHIFGADQHANPAGPVEALRSRHKRQYAEHAAENRHELAPPHDVLRLKHSIGI
jgi:hypothetical protein